MDDLNRKTLESIGLEEQIGRIDHYLAGSSGQQTSQTGLKLGIRLALGMALELKQGKSLGAETCHLIAEWIQTYGEDTVEAAIEIARSFLINPGKLKQKLAQRLFS